MVGQSKKSTKRSAASFRPPEVTLFLDRSLGRLTVAEVLRAAGATVAVHDDHFPQDAPDGLWLAEAGRQGWIVLTKDRRIRYRRNELMAAQEAGVRLFVLTAGQLTGAEVGTAFAGALESIYRLAAEEPAPFVARVNRNGVVSLY